MKKYIIKNYDQFPQSAEAISELHKAARSYFPDGKVMTMNDLYERIGSLGTAFRADGPTGVWPDNIADPLCKFLRSRGIDCVLEDADLAPLPD